jgi:hypothetical protein
MRRLLSQGPVTLTVLAILGTCVGLFWPVASYVVPNDSATGIDPVTISDFNARYDVDAMGNLTALETITAVFPYGRHGIFRFFDQADPSDSHVRYRPKDITVRLDGSAVPVDLLWERGTRYRVAKIGDPDHYVSPGRHVYTIGYRIAGAVSPTSAGRGATDSSSWVGSDDSHAVFYWDVIAPG